MFPIEIDNTGYRYYFWNHPEQYASDICFVVKPSKRTRRLPSPQTQSKNPITTKM